MDYTVSLQVQHQLAVFPTHLYQGYSVELQVHVFSIPLVSPVFFSLLSSSILSMISGVHACRGVSVTLRRCFTAEGRHGCRFACWYFSSPRFLLLAAGETVRSGGCLRGALLMGSLAEVELTSHKQVWHAGEQRVLGVRLGTPQGVP